MTIEKYLKRAETKNKFYKSNGWNTKKKFNTKKVTWETATATFEYSPATKRNKIIFKYILLHWHTSTSVRRLPVRPCCLHWKTLGEVEIVYLLDNGM
jgi:hypothetical protein